MTYQTESWVKEHWAALTCIACIATLVLTVTWSYGRVWRVPTDTERCTFQNGTYVKMISMAEFCGKVVDRWVSQGYDVQRYGIKGSDFIVLEKRNK